MERRGNACEEGSPVLGHVPTMPPEDLMLSELAIMTGGRDQEGRPIITISSKQFGVMKSTALEEVIKYYIAITRPQVKHAGFGFVVDFSRANESIIDIVIATLNTVQAQLKGAVAMLYAVSPIIKDLRKHMLAKLGLRKSKKAKYKSMPHPLFKSTAHYNISDLYNYVDKSNLTQDLGGYLNYDHTAWIKFRKLFEPFFRDAEELIKRIPVAFQQLTALSDFPKGKTLDEVQQVKSQIQQQNEMIRRELEIDALLSQCISLLKQLRKPDDNAIFVAMAQKPMFKDTLHIIERYHERLSGVDQKADVLYQKAERRINQSIQHLQFESNLNQLIDWINNKGMAYLKTNTEVPDCLGQAEILKNHYETGFLTSAKEVIHHSETLLQNADEMVIRDHYNIPVILSTSKNFTNLVQQFKEAVHKRHKLLHHYYIFYILLEKCLLWYRKSLRFLPVELLDHKEFFVTPSRNHKHPYLATVEWREESKNFLSKYPPPSSSELQRLKDSILLMEDMRVRTQARLLIHRCLWLKCLFDTREVMSPKELLKVLQWQTNYLEGYDDIELYDEESDDAASKVAKKSSNGPKQSSKQNERDNRRRSDDDEQDGPLQQHPYSSFDSRDYTGDRHNNIHAEKPGDTQSDKREGRNDRRKIHQYDSMSQGEVMDMQRDSLKSGKKSKHRSSRQHKKSTKHCRRYSDTNLYKNPDTSPRRLSDTDPHRQSQRYSETSPHGVGSGEMSPYIGNDARVQRSDPKVTRGHDNSKQKHVSISLEKPSVIDEPVNTQSMPNLHQPRLEDIDTQNQTFGIYGDSDDMEGMLNGPPRGSVDNIGRAPQYYYPPTNTQWPNIAAQQQMGQANDLYYTQPRQVNESNTSLEQLYGLVSPSQELLNAHLALSLLPQNRNVSSYQRQAVYNTPSNTTSGGKLISPSNTDSGYTQSSPNISGNTNSSTQESPQNTTLHVPGNPRYLPQHTPQSAMQSSTRLPTSAVTPANQMPHAPVLTNQQSFVYANQNMQRTLVPWQTRNPYRDTRPQPQFASQQYLAPMHHFNSTPTLSVLANQQRQSQVNQSSLPYSANRQQPLTRTLPFSPNEQSPFPVNQLTIPPVPSANGLQVPPANHHFSSVPPMSTLPDQITASQLQLPVPSQRTVRYTVPTSSQLPQRTNTEEMLSSLGLSSYLTPLEKLELEVGEDKQKLEKEIRDDHIVKEDGLHHQHESVTSPSVQNGCQVNRKSFSHSDLRGVPDVFGQDERLSSSQSQGDIMLDNTVDASLLEQLTNLMRSYNMEESQEIILPSRRDSQPRMSRTVSSDGVVSGSESDPALQEYKKMLDDAKKLRMASEESLLQEKLRFESLRLQQEELKQSEVEESLKRSEQMLQEEESVLQQEEELEKLIQLDDEKHSQLSPGQPSPKQPPPPMQPSSLSPSLGTPLSLEEELKTIEKQELRLKHRIVRRGSSLQLSDEGIVLDNTSPDDLVDRGSQESGLSSISQRRSNLHEFKQIQDLDSEDLVAFIENERKERPKIKMSVGQVMAAKDINSTTTEKRTGQRLLQDKLARERLSLDADSERDDSRILAMGDNEIDVEIEKKMQMAAMKNLEIENKNLTADKEELLNQISSQDNELGIWA
ncbi:uncharacterized protein LOC144434404 [Glandiceps talaboti]